MPSAFSSGGGCSKRYFLMTSSASLRPQNLLFYGPANWTMYLPVTSVRSFVCPRRTPTCRTIPKPSICVEGLQVNGNGTKSGAGKLDWTAGQMQSQGEWTGYTNNGWRLPATLMVNEM